MPPLMHTEIYHSCQSLRPSILRSHAGRCPLPLRGHHLHFVVHHDRPISVSFLDRWRGHEKLGNEAGAVEGREESYILGYHLIRLSEGFRQPCTSQVSSSLASQLSCMQLSQSNRHIFSRCKQCSARAPYDPFVSNQPRSAQSNEYKMRYGMRKLTGSCLHVIHLRRS
jgi:hypothetical protein